MKLGDYKSREDYVYFREWRTLKGILKKESKNIEERIRCAEPLGVSDDLFQRCVVEPEKARKEAFDSIIEYMDNVDD